LAPVERLPVSFAKASMTLPTIVSTLPSALLRDDDFATADPLTVLSNFAQLRDHRRGGAFYR
jgi:hypothetical protein